MYRQGGSHHSSNGDQLGKAGRRRRQSFRCTAREGATTSQTETNWAGQGGGGRVSGVQPGREQPQLKRRPTGQGREEEAEFQAYSQGGSNHRQITQQGEEAKEEYTSP